MFDFAVAVVASLAGAFAGNLGASARDRASDCRRSRSEAAERLLPALHELRRVVARRDVKTDVEACAKSVMGAYVALDDASGRLPDGWRHLKRSIRGAVGESTGLGFLDISPLPAIEVVSFDALWLDFAAEYFGHVTSTITRWARVTRESEARAVLLLDYDTWLRQTGRYAVGEGLWPEGPSRRR